MLSYTYKDLLETVNFFSETHRHQKATESDIFEELLLESSGVEFSLKEGEYNTCPYDENPVFFLMNLPLSKDKINKFIDYFNETYGEGTARECHDYERQENSFFVLVNIEVVVKNILPGWIEKLQKDFPGKGKLVENGIFSIKNNNSDGYDNDNEKEKRNSLSKKN